MCVSSHAASNCMEENITDASDIVETIQKLSKSEPCFVEDVLIHKIAETSKKTAKLVAEAAMSPMLPK